MRLSFKPGLLITLIAIPAFSIPTLPQRKEAVGAYYYPWYFPGKWADLASQLTPTLGWYQTDDMSVVTKHIDTAAHYGIDVFFMSWWKKTDVTDTHLRNGFMKAPNNNKLKFAMVVEPLGELDTLDGKRDGVVDFQSAEVVKGWVEIFRYFKDSFWSHPSYYKVDGKPVVLVYVTRTFKNFGSQHLDSLKSHVGPVYIMADEAFIGTQSDPLTARNGVRNRFSVFDSYVSYNSYEAALIQPGDSALKYQNRVGMPYYRKWAEQTVFHPPIMPYYQDFRPGHPPLPGSDAQFKDIIRDIRALPQWAPAGDSLNRIYMVTSWNEWFEGTSLEPSTERGIGPCKVLREAFVERGTHSRREPVKNMGTANVRIAKGQTYVCMDKGAKGNLIAGGACNAGSQVLELVTLDIQGEAALRDPATGRYLSVYADNLLYPLSDYVGTWEIFKVAQWSAMYSLQSKKNGAFLNVDGTGAIAATGTTGDPKIWFSMETLSASKGKAHMGANAPGYVLSVQGEDLLLVAARAERLRVTLSDLGGRTLLSRDLSGAGIHALGKVPGNGIQFLTVESNGIVRREMVAGTGRVNTR
jgi:hypothetical protein